MKHNMDSIARSFKQIDSKMHIQQVQLDILLRADQQRRMVSSEESNNDDQAPESANDQPNDDDSDKCKFSSPQGLSAKLK